jgi:hypothetical protein
MDDPSNADVDWVQKRFDRNEMIRSGAPDLFDALGNACKACVESFGRL